MYMYNVRMVMTNDGVGFCPLKNGRKRVNYRRHSFARVYTSMATVRYKDNCISPANLPTCV